MYYTLERFIEREPKAQNGVREIAKLEISIRARARNTLQSPQIGSRAFSSTVYTTANLSPSWSCYVLTSVNP